VLHHIFSSGTRYTFGQNYKEIALKTVPSSLSPRTFRPGQHLKMLDDTIDDPYRERRKLSEPSVCSDCNAVYHEGRWQWLTPPVDARPTRCAACKRIHEKLPAGYVAIEGQFAFEHRDELLNLVRHLEIRKKSQHPLQRIIAIEEQAAQLLITTTDIHLARGIGDALHQAYKGDLNFHYNEAEYLLRVHWQR
jgi:hypothetical protein